MTKSPAPIMQAPQLEHSETLYASARCECRRVTYRLASGAVAERPVVLSPGSVVIVARPQADQVVMVRQFRYALQDWTWELPAGTRSADERPLVCAQRELTEEAGYQAQRWQQLCDYHPAPGLTNQRMSVFSADDLTYVGAQPESDEALTSAVWTIEDVQAAIADGRITDAKTLLGLTLTGISITQMATMSESPAPTTDGQSS